MNLQVGVKLIIRSNDGQILMLRRSGYGDLDGSWDIPGGRIDASEDLLTALNREIREEIGLELQGLPKLLAAQDIFPKGKELHVVRLTYLLDTAAIDVESLSLSHEHSMAAYVLPFQLSRVDTDPLILEVTDTLA